MIEKDKVEEFYKLVDEVEHNLEELKQNAPLLKTTWISEGSKSVHFGCTRELYDGIVRFTLTELFTERDVEECKLYTRLICNALIRYREHFTQHLEEKIEMLKQINDEIKNILKPL